MASRFAHLLGSLGASGNKKAVEEDDPDKKEDREDAKTGGKKAEDEDEPDDKRDDETMDEYRERKKREQEEEDDTDKSQKKSKKAEERDDDKKAAGVRAERERCKTIFASPAAGVRPDLAAHLAFETDLPASAAIASLKVAASAAPATKRAGLSERMDRTPNPDVGSGGTEAGAPPLHQRLMRAHKLATGKE